MKVRFKDIPWNANIDLQGATIGKVYDVVEVHEGYDDGEGFFSIVNNNGEPAEFFQSRFEVVEDIETKPTTVLSPEEQMVQISLRASIEACSEVRKQQLEGLHELEDKFQMRFETYDQARLDKLRGEYDFYLNEVAESDIMLASLNKVLKYYGG